MSPEKQEPLPGMEPTPELERSAAERDAFIGRIARNAESHSAEVQAMEIMTVSEAAIDQGFGPQERGTPLPDPDRPTRTPEAIAAQKAANEKRRKRVGHRENRYTDYKKD